MINKQVYYYNLIIIFIFIVSSNSVVLGQEQKQFSKIFIEGDYSGKNMHELLMDININGGIYIAYDVDQLSKISISSNPNGKNLNQLFESNLNQVAYEIEEHSSHTFLLRCDDRALNTVVNTEDDLNIQGIIQDNDGLPLAYAYVVSPNLRYGTYADSLGRYTLQIPKNHSTLEICAGNLGFENQCHELDLSSTQYNFTLKEDLTILKPLLVKDVAIPIHVKENSFSLKMSNRFNISSPGGNDPLRKAALLPSVQADNDLSAEITIRNAQSDETAIMFDNIPLFASYHYAGFISSINPVTVNSVAVYPCYTPAGYSNKSGGLINISSKENEQYGLSGNIGINFLYASALLQYKNDNHLIQLAGRTNIGDISNKSFYILGSQDDNAILNPDGTRKSLVPVHPKYKFEDFNFKYKWDITENWELSLLHLMSNDVSESLLEFDFRPRDRRDTILRQRQIESEETNSRGSSIQLKGKLNNQWNINLSLVNSKLDFNNEATFSIIGRTGVSKPRTKDVFQISNQVDWNEGKVQMTYQPSSTNKLDFGYSLNSYQTELYYKFEDAVTGQNDITNLEHHIFGSWNKKFGNKYELKIGGNMTIDDSETPIYLSPRISFSHLTNDYLKFGIEYGQYRQNLRKINHENPYGKSFEFWTISRQDSIPIIDAQLIDLNMNYKKDKLILSSSIFYRFSDGDLAWIAQRPHRKIAPNKPRPKLKYIYYQGMSKSYGFETMFYYHFKPFQFLISYQLSKSLVSYDRIKDGEWRPDENDRRHRITGLLNYRYQHWTIEGKYSFISGKPFLDLGKIEEEINREQRTYEDIYSLLPDYKRFDIGLSYYFNLKNMKISTFVEINNVFNNANTDYRQYYTTNAQTPISGTSYDQLERFVNIGIDISF